MTLLTRVKVTSSTFTEESTLQNCFQDYRVWRIRFVRQAITDCSSATLTAHSIRRATPLHASGPVIAVKFINKAHAFSAGRLRPKQLQLETSLHSSVSPHPNIITFLSHGEDEQWIWLCLELADGGDLFDKIEADEGVKEDVAHLYFVQLTSAISWCHGKGVAHRDIKPENMLLSAGGNLKLADFGLATQFLSPRSGQRKLCGMVCGSMPYIAPEIVDVGAVNEKRKQGQEKMGYDPSIADLWSCAIVLFVLMTGNTPWDAPVLKDSYEYYDFVKTSGRPADDLWEKVPAAALSLLRGMLKVSTTERFTLQDVQKHPWYTRRNPEMNQKGMVANSINLATQMLESLRIDFNAVVPTSQPDAMDIDGPSVGPSVGPDVSRFAATQPEVPMDDAALDWEAPPRLTTGVSSSQPMSIHDGTSLTIDHQLLLDSLAQDPSMSQFAPTPSVPLTLTQQARQFKDIVPAHSLARFFSHLPFPQLLPMLHSALHRLSVPVVPPSAAAMQGQEALVSIRIKTVDARQQLLQGNILIESIQVPGQANKEVLEVRFAKAKGDPLGWRRLFKQVVVLCKDGVIAPHG